MRAKARRASPQRAMMPFVRELVRPDRHWLAIVLAAMLIESLMSLRQLFLEGHCLMPGKRQRESAQVVPGVAGADPFR
jgi:hypothetical protein